MKLSFPRLLGAFAVLLLGCGSQLQHGLEERDANEMLSVLLERGFRAQKVPEKGKKLTWAIEVETAEASEALKVLTQLKLPSVSRATTKSIMQSPGLIETASAERLRQLEAQEGDLEETLETMDGVAGASVELVVPAAPRPGQPLVPSKASVLLRAHSTAIERLTQQRADLRALVAGAVEGLKPEDVVLVIDPVTLVATPPRGEKAGGALRPLVIGLAAALTLVAALLVVLALRLRRTCWPEALKAPEPERAAARESPQPQRARPVVSPSVQRKVA